ncbi:MAG: 6-phosphogluconolactonase [Opitutaceae bacterium]|nr:6-phosphogluconolactonase [Opitutaceae bacterium]
MISQSSIRTEKYGHANVRVYATSSEMAIAAASEAAQVLRAALNEHGSVRIIVGTGNSQAEMIDQLVADQRVDWSRVEVFHMDEYLGISDQHPASFRRWLRERVEQREKLAACSYLAGDARDVEGEIARYSALLNRAPIDLAFVGFGENGHIAFNDPHVADFNDAATVKIAELDAKCRQQQVGEGHFPSLAAVPTRALTLSCPALFRAKRWICCVPDTRKAQAVRDALEGPIGTRCPASIVRTHSAASVYLDAPSASLLSPRDAC